MCQFANEIQKTNLLINEFDNMGNEIQKRN
jgi:hypothetical protein